MSEWREVKLDEVVKFGNGKKKPDSEGNIPIYGGNGILGYSSEANYDDETIIIGRVGAYCGSVYYENNPIWVSDNALSAKPKNAHLNQHAGGSSHPLVTQSLLNSLEYNFCTNPTEQTAIAEILSSLDDKIDLLHRQNKTLEELAQTLFRQWFIEEAQDEWEDVIGNTSIQIIDGDRGKNYPKSTEFFSNEHCLFLNAKNVTNNGFNFNECNFITQEKDEVLRSGKLERNDIVLTTRGTVGNLALYDELITYNHIRINSGMVIFRSENISSIYLYIFLKSQFFTDSVIEQTSGSAQPQLPIRDIKKIKIIIPPQDILENFLLKVNPLYKKINSNQQQIKTLENMRDTLLPKLMSGEVRVKCF